MNILLAKVSPSLQDKLQFSDNYFSKLFLPEFCSLLLVSYFSKKFASKMGAANGRVFHKYPIKESKLAMGTYL